MSKEEIRELLKKATESIKASRLLFQEGLFDFAASRAYYAMFYLAEAILLTKGLSFSKHKAVISSFGKEFIKTGLVADKFHQYLIDAFQKRRIGDYGVFEHLTPSEVKKLTEEAERFLKMTINFLKEQGYED